MKNLTFDQLPNAVSQLFQKLEVIEKLLTEQKNNVKSNEQLEELLNITQAAEFLKLSVPTIYSKVSRGELPVMKRAKRLYFSQKELMSYLKEGRRKSNYEIEAEAKAYLLKNKKGLNNGF